MEFSYDVIPYPGSPFAQTHPSRLATLATLFGMRPAPVERCRVLELGCTDGGNLLPMALTLPASEFVGVDLSGRAVARGQDVARQLGVRNIELRACDVRQVEKTWGEFDYIIAHGLYSWVPERVREHLLKISKENLAQNGVAYISYNAHPGGHLRKMIREMMLYHARGVPEPAERIRRATALLDFLAKAAPPTVDEYRALLSTELDQILARDPSVMFHDELAEIYEPLFFHEFMSHAHRHGLQFLSEANYHDMQDSAFPDLTGKTLQGFAGEDRIAHEQYRDFLKCRKFRQTLLCHEEVQLDTDVKGERVHSFYVASAAKEVPAQAESGLVREFHGPFGSALKTAHPLAGALMGWLIEAWPRQIHFKALLDRAGAENLDALGEIVLATYSAGLIELHSLAPRFTTAIGERPQASPLARLQARNGSTLTTLRHGIVEIEDEIVRNLIVLLDGTRDRAALKRELLPLTGQIEEAVFERELERNLGKAAMLALLMS
ncbi:MAG: class I SAM-dependent methyltransferase [Acidobacteriota bacterium]|nr:class I SAM-dependent methyltransferase [Acidobacteriota bacterium]